MHNRWGLMMFPMKKYFQLVPIRLPGVCAMLVSQQFCQDGKGDSALVLLMDGTAFCVMFNLSCSIWILLVLL